MQPSIRYTVATTFSRRPGGRKRANGVHSGEEFREDVARALLQQYEHVVFDLSGAAGYSSGFLDEAFGGLVRYYKIEELRQRIEIVAEDDPGAVETAWARIKDADKEARH
ncbi:STAS-like domain-containing protein [Lysobacter sp. Root494]|uniref:STAS-like domain-containing protein n=1 Tax=Lysobacter sp. Root494 TaxID=1736549 RepID=UPI000A423BD6|nr:STAS-like domain-containing protein [Lysobacter sp. Root494]